MEENYIEDSFDCIPDQEEQTLGYTRVSAITGLRCRKIFHSPGKQGRTE